MTRGRQQIFAGLLCAGLLSGCAGPAGEAAPAPGPNVEEHWSVLEETGRLPAVGSRWRDGPMEELTPAPDYGALVPFAGAAYYLSGYDGALADDFPRRIVLSMDTKGGRIAIKGWQESAGITVDEMFERIRDLPLAAVLNTNVDVEGQRKGIDEAQARDFISRCPCRVIASGGVTSRRDAEVLSDAGAEGAVVGLAMYTGVISPWEWDTPWLA